METEKAFNSDIKTGFIKNLKHKNVREFFNDSEELFKKIIMEKLSETPVKEYIVFVAVYEILKPVSNTTDLKFFNSKAVPIFHLTDISEWFDKNVSSPIMNDMEHFQGNGSGWRLESILYLNVHICKYGSMHAGSSYIDLPDIYKK